MAKLIFMGTADFACACLDGLEGAGMTPGLIITRPDGVAGRNRRPSQPPVKKWALSRGVEIWQPRMINNPDSIQRLGAICPDLFLVAAYGSILRSEVLAIPRLGAINVHASLLPDLRGAAPIEWAIMLGRTETGITTMYMDEGLDTGDIILQQATKIGPKETGHELRERLAAMAKNLLPDTVSLVRGGAAPRIPQPPGEYTYAPPLDSSLERIHWQRTAVDIANQIRALAPKPGCFCIFRGLRLKLIRAVALEGSAPPGHILRRGKDLFIGTGHGLLQVIELQLQGKKALSASDFINGYRLEEGELFL